MKVYIILLVVVVNLHRRSTREVMITWEKRDKWYEHEPESVLQNEGYKALPDFSIQTDHVVEAQRQEFYLERLAY